MMFFQEFEPQSLILTMFFFVSLESPFEERLHQTLNSKKKTAGITVVESTANAQIGVPGSTVSSSQEYIQPMARSVVTSIGDSIVTNPTLQLNFCWYSNFPRLPTLPGGPNQHEFN